MIMIDDPPAALSPLEREAHEWVMRFASGTASRADIEALRKWAARDPAHAEAFDRASRMWRALGPIGREMSAEACVSGRGAWTAASVRRPGVLRRRAFLGGALAASAVGAVAMVAQPPLGLWPSWTELAADYRTETGERRQITLANSASIEMNTRTSIVMRPAGREASLIAELITGEAMVSAPLRAQEPFMMRVADGRIVASDARFNVRFEGREVCVTCLAGEVRVERREAGLRLPAGGQVFYSDQGIGPVVTADPAKVTAWQDGILIFESTPVAQVIAEINRYRPGKIILADEELGRRLFNARLRIENIGRVVGQLEQAFGARATTLPGGIVVLS